MSDQLYRLTKYGDGVKPQMDGLIEEFHPNIEAAGKELDHQLKLDGRPKYASGTRTLAAQAIVNAALTPGDPE